jgi:hypothetical protein
VYVVDKPVSWIGYSLDGGQNVTIAGNTTLTGLSSGLHNVILYANDTYRNMGASETVRFNVAEPFPVVPVAVFSVTVIVLVSTGLFVYFKKHKNQTPNNNTGNLKTREKICFDRKSLCL